MSKTASECIVQVPEMPVKSADSGRKEISKKQVHFFSSPNRVFFPDVVDGNVSTEKFLDAYAYFIGIYELLGSLLEPIVKGERMNHEIVTTFYNKDTKKHRFLKDMLLAEKATGKQIVAEKCVHMIRNIKLLNTTLQSAHEEASEGKKPDINKLLYESYKKYINPYHTFFYRQLFKTALLVFTPSTDNFIKCLHYGEDCKSMMDFLEDVKSYLSNVSPLVDYLYEMFIDNDLPIYFKET